MLTAFLWRWSADRCSRHGKQRAGTFMHNIVNSAHDERGSYLHALSVCKHTPHNFLKYDICVVSQYLKYIFTALEASFNKSLHVRLLSDHINKSSLSGNES